jgi:hypothetical protein
MTGCAQSHWCCDWGNYNSCSGGRRGSRQQQEAQPWL